MPPKTRQVFERLATNAALKDFVLVGGTALSVQIGHRLSEDLDFCLFAESMDGDALDVMIRDLASHHSVELMTSPSKITQAKINGIDLLQQSRDYLIDGVKVTFFARNDVAYQYFSRLEKINEAGVVFPVMAAQSIFAMKAWLLQKRIKSRDLFDLMQLVQSGHRSFQAILDEARLADVAIYSEETIKNALMGVIPVASDDEGFATIGLNVTLDQIYAFFKAQIDQYEIAQASQI